MAVLREVVVGADPAAWAEVGFRVEPGAGIGLDGVSLRLVTGVRGIRSCGLEGVEASARDGLALHPPGPRAPAGRHHNGACALDHVVAVTPDPGRTRTALAAEGLEPRRVRDAGAGVSQAFYVLVTALLELTGPIGEDGPAWFWGLAVVVEDLDRARAAMGDALGPDKEAVQPGRRIATVREEAGLGLPVALMTPR